MARKTHSTDQIPDKILDKALALAAERGWAAVSLAAIAAAADVPLAEVRRHFDSRAAILRAVLRRIDAEALAARDPAKQGQGGEPGSADERESARDRLFDLMMARFEALTPHRQALASLMATAPADPLAAAGLLPAYLNSMVWMLEGAGISTTGLRGLLRANGLAALNLAVSRVWLKDESPDLTKTMVALDRWLARADWLERETRGMRFCLGRRRAPDAPAPHAAAPDTPITEPPAGPSVQDPS